MVANYSRIGTRSSDIVLSSLANRESRTASSKSVTPRSGAPRPRRLTIVLAQWCPHCVPLSIREGRKFARRLRVPFRTLDIDRRRELTVADRLVRDYGDASVDYLIPQVFLEWTDGSVQHLLTGFSEDPARTARAWKDLFTSDWLRSIGGGVRT